MKIVNERVTDSLAWNDPLVMLRQLILGRVRRVIGQLQFDTLSAAALGAGPDPYSRALLTAFSDELWDIRERKPFKGTSKGRIVHYRSWINASPPAVLSKQKVSHLFPGDRVGKTGIVIGRLPNKRCLVFDPHAVSDPCVVVVTAEVNLEHPVSGVHQTLIELDVRML